jgi:hypothetical protein
MTSVSRSRCCDHHVRVSSRTFGSSSSRFGAEVNAYTLRILVAEERSQPIQAREYSVTRVHKYAVFRRTQTIPYSISRRIAQNDNSHIVFILHRCRDHPGPRDRNDART